VRTQAARELRREETCAEGHLWRRLRAHRLAGHYFKRQQPVGRFIVDFVCLRRRLIIEVDGEHHQRQLEADRERTEFLEALGYSVARFSNQEVLEQTAAVLERIRRDLSLKNKKYNVPVARSAASSQVLLQSHEVRRRPT
jgi:very-short-patch-repair endonuclease